MAHESVSIRRDRGNVELGSLSGTMLGVGLVLAVVGGLLGGFLGLAKPERHELFFHAYLVVYCYFLSVTLGALFFVLLHHLARAGWSATLRRIAEGLTGNFILMAILFVPLVIPTGADGHMAIQTLYHWAHAGVADPHSPHFDPIIAGKSAWLNPQAFYLRMVAYFVLWLVLAFYFRTQSIRQDASGDPALSRQMEKVAAPGMILLGISLTLAFLDLLMSLNPHWYSTIFGVYLFAGSVLGALLLIMLLTLWIQRSGRLRHEITTEHYHDLGKLAFAFTFFWGYIAFSQYMLIWYANMPEETQFYMPRQLGNWVYVSILLLVFHLLIPFAGLLSRHAKRRLGIFVFFAVWLLLAHLLDLFWIVMPHAWANKVPAWVGDPHMVLPDAMERLVVSRHSVYTLKPEFGQHLSDINAPLEPVALLMVAALFVGMLGLYLASTALFLRSVPLVPLRDPKLPEALAFENV